MKPDLLPLILTDELRLKLEALAQKEPDNIRQVADGLKGQTRDNYLLALKRKKYG